MVHKSRYFSLSLESLRALGSWAADCAERALSVYETHAGSDPGLVPRLRAFGRLPVGESELLSCVPLPCLRFRLRVRQMIPLLLQPLAPPALQRRVLTRIHWRMFNKPNILSVPQPMPHWHLSSTMPAIQTSGRARSAGQSNTLPLTCAKSCCRCPLVKREPAGWTRSYMNWIRVSAVSRWAVDEIEASP